MRIIQTSKTSHRVFYKNIEYVRYENSILDNEPYYRNIKDDHFVILEDEIELEEQFQIELKRIKREKKLKRILK